MQKKQYQTQNVLEVLHLDDKESWVFFIHVSGLTSSEGLALKEALSKLDMSILNVPNKPLRAALKSTGLNSIGSLLSGPSAVLTSRSGPSSWKKFFTILKGFPKVLLLGGLSNDRLYHANELKNIQITHQEPALLSHQLTTLVSGVNQIALYPVNALITILSNKKAE